MTGKLVDEILAKCNEPGNKSGWVKNIENILVALEMYRREEEKAVQRLADILNANGVIVSEDDLRGKDSDDIKEMIDTTRKAKEAI